MGHGSIRLGGVQFSGTKGAKDANIDKAIAMIREAQAQGAQIIMTPECALSGFIGGDIERQLAEPIPGPTSRRFAALARELGVYLLVGMPESRAGNLHNAIVVLDPSGSLMGIMRKVHINRYETRFGWRNGSAFPVWDFETATGAMRGGIMICYDREAPESARLLMLQDADVIFNPLACGCPIDDIHRCLLRTRAFENEVYIFMVNHAAPRETGHSFAVDFRGELQNELGGAEGILLYDVDLDALNAGREKGIYGKHHRRPELYGPLAEASGQIHPADANLPPESAWKP